MRNNHEKKENKSNPQTPGVSRRTFMAGAGALAFSVVQPQAIRSSQANSKIELGLIGCGGRGKWIADLFANHGGYKLVAVADYFQDRVDGVAELHNVPAQRRYTTLSGYRKLLEGKLDAVAIISPPYFHPEQAAASVEAGRHVYLAKPLAVDVPGCNSITASGKKATTKGQTFLVDFQTRADPFFIEALRRVHAGDIGDLVFGESSYHTGRLSVKKSHGPVEGRLRNWTFDKALSGDIITEQNIHTLDVASWIMNEQPLNACGSGGRMVRTDVGDCWDHFTLHYQYPNSVGITFSSRQFNGHGTQGGIRNRMYGTKGVLETQYGGTVMIRGENFYRGGRSPGIYKEGAVANIATFHDNIIKGNFKNPTVAPSVQSNLVTILGRTAAYENRMVTWNEILKSNLKLDGRLEGLKS